VIRVLACFCLWGGCFIIAAAIAVQILDLHGYVLAIELMAIATMAAWLLLPKLPDASAEMDRKSRAHEGRSKKPI